MARKMRLISEEQYTKIAYLARRLVPQSIISREIGFTAEAFSRRKKRDADLRATLQGNYNQGKISLFVASMRKSVDHHYTICKECHKIADGEWYDSCPFCDEDDIPANKGKHKHVTHKLVEADTAMLIHMCKHHLGQTDKSLLTVQGVKGKPLKFENLSEEEADRKLAKLATLLEVYKTEPERGHDSMLVDVRSLR